MSDVSFFSAVLHAVCWCWTFQIKGQTIEKRWKPVSGVWRLARKTTEKERQKERERVCGHGRGHIWVISAVASQALPICLNAVTTVTQTCSVPLRALIISLWWMGHHWLSDHLTCLWGCVFDCQAFVLLATMSGNHSYQSMVVVKVLNTVKTEIMFFDTPVFMK